MLAVTSSNRHHRHWIFSSKNERRPRTRTTALATSTRT